VKAELLVRILDENEEAEESLYNLVRAHPASNSAARRSA